MDVGAITASFMRKTLDDFDTMMNSYALETGGEAFIEDPTPLEITVRYHYLPVNE